MSGILVVERIVLESVSAGNSHPKEICEDTGLKSPIVDNILCSLEKRDILKINFKSGKYVINDEKQDEWMAIINHQENVKEEVKDIFVALVNLYFEQDKRPPDMIMKVQKIAFTSLEEKIFKNLLNNLECFIEAVKKDKEAQLKSSKLQEHSIVFWGVSDYASIVRETI